MTGPRVGLVAGPITQTVRVAHSNAKVAGSSPAWSTKEALPFSVFLLFLFVKSKALPNVYLVGRGVKGSPLFVLSIYYIFTFWEGLPTLLL